MDTFQHTTAAQTAAVAAGVPGYPKPVRTQPKCVMVEHCYVRALHDGRKKERQPGRHDRDLLMLFKSGSQQQGAYPANIS